MERVVAFAAIVILFFVSCTACVHTIKRIYLNNTSQENQQKFYPSVARVERLPGPTGFSEGAGTAFAIDDDYLLTAGHRCSRHAKELAKGQADVELKLVMADREGMEINSDFRATVVAYDSPKDICILFSPNHPFIPLELSENYDAVETEDPVIIVGAPRWLFPVRVDGRVVQKEPVLIYRDGKPHSKWLFLKADITKGNSGSPVVWNGQVIGMIVEMNENPKRTCLAVPVTHLLDFIRDHIR